MEKNYEELIERIEVEYLQLNEIECGRRIQMEEAAEKLVISKLFASIIKEELEGCDTDIAALLQYENPIERFIQYCNSSNVSLENGIMNEIDAYIVQARELIRKG